MTTLAAVALCACVFGGVAGDLRWLRVAQREHYLAGATVRFGWRWWVSRPVNIVLAIVALACAGGSTILPAIAIGAGIVVTAGPVGLGLRGRTSHLAWTRRLAQVAVFTVCLQAAAIATVATFAGLAGAAATAAFCAIAGPGFVDVALAVLQPLEDRLARRYVSRAEGVLARVRPLVVGITGSYGKTTTKNYIAYLLSGDRNVVASPRSFNNRAGLSRTVNEHLTPGTDVLVAEMGAYGPGEIAALCTWLRPEVVVITSIGPAHLERFGSLERTLEAKAEITSNAARRGPQRRRRPLTRARRTSRYDP